MLFGHVLLETRVDVVNVPVRSRPMRCAVFTDALHTNCSARNHPNDVSTGKVQEYHRLAPEPVECCREVSGKFGGLPHPIVEGGTCVLCHKIQTASRAHRRH